MNTTQIQIQTDIQELKEDEKAGMYNYLGARIYRMRELEKIIAKEDRNFAERAEQEQRDLYERTR